VPDEDSPEVGGLQNTGTNLGASIGTALAGSILIGALSTSFIQGIHQNPAVPPSVTAAADVQLASARCSPPGVSRPSSRAGRGPAPDHDTTDAG
jgi:hypothetical protein